MSDLKTVTEIYRVHGDDAVKKSKELVREGNVRRISIANEDGDTLIELPLTFGVVGAAMMPVAAAVGAVTAMLTECTITVVRQVPDAEEHGRAQPHLSAESGHTERFNGE